MRRFRWIPVLLLPLAVAAPAAAQVLYGRVTDAADGTPVAAAQVVALDSAGTAAVWALSGRDGRFELRLAEGGAFRLHVSRVGFRDEVSPGFAIAPRERREMDMSLRTDVVRLEAVEARSRVTPPFRDPRARGFFDRMQRGRGWFYTPEQIIQLNRRRTTDLLTTYAGISLRRGRLWLGGDRRGCSPTIYIDGVRRPTVLLDDALAPGDIWGIEIYQHPWEIPSDLPRDDMVANCGVVMIWTPHS